MTTSSEFGVDNTLDSPGHESDISPSIYGLIVGPVSS